VRCTELRPKRGGAVKAGDRFVEAVHVLERNAALVLAETLLDAATLKEMLGKNF